jgi:hypothetical protein
MPSIPHYAVTVSASGDLCIIDNVTNTLYLYDAAHDPGKPWPLVATLDLTKTGEPALQMVPATQPSGR